MKRKAVVITLSLKVALAKASGCPLVETEHWSSMNQQRNPC